MAREVQVEDLWAPATGAAAVGECMVVAEHHHDIPHRRSRCWPLAAASSGGTLPCRLPEYDSHRAALSVSEAGHPSSTTSVRQSITPNICRSRVGLRI